MRYRAKYRAGFDSASFCYMVYPKKHKCAALYDVNMTGYQKVKDEYVLDRVGYNNYLINYTLSGKCKMTYGGREYNIKKGDLVFINCAEPHRFEQSENSGWEFVFLHMQGLGVSYVYDDFIDATGNLYEKYDGKILLDKLSRLHALLAESESTRRDKHTSDVNVDDERLCCDMAEIVYSVLTDTVRKINMLPRDLPHNLKTAIDYIHENFARELTLDEVASRVYLSKYHFERMFLRYTGKTFYAYVTRLRFERARLLLDSTDKTLAEIATEIGYSDIQPLIKLFKRNFGVTPTAYRKEKDNYK